MLPSHQDSIPPWLLRLVPPGSPTLASVLLSLGRQQSVQGARRMESVHRFVAHNRNEGEQPSEPVHDTFLHDPGEEALKIIPTLKKKRVWGCLKGWATIHRDSSLPSTSLKCFIYLWWGGTGAMEVLCIFRLGLSILMHMNSTLTSLKCSINARKDPLQQLHLSLGRRHI